MLNIITKTNGQRSNQTFNMQIGFYLWDKLLYVFLKSNKGSLPFYTNNFEKNFLILIDMKKHWNQLRFK
jgi:hypothetical protein